MILVKRIRSLLSLLIIPLLLLQSAPVSAQSTGEDCSEAKLRDLGVAIINCTGESNSICSVGGGDDTDPGGGDGVVTKSMADFVDKYGQQAYDNSIKSGVPYEFTIAQAILEGGLPLSDLAANHNNFFGIKAGSSWTGKTVLLRTREEVGGKSVYVMAPFRVYDSPEAGFYDHDLFLRKNKRYAAAFAYSKDPMQFLVEIKKAGYATDSKYVSIVGRVIKSVTAYVSQIGKWPPSKDVAYALDPDFTGPADTDGTTLPGDSGATDTANECGATGGVAIDSTGFAFPLITTQAALIKYGWCYKSLTNCHHDYNAADIFDTEGVQVVAAKPGTVVNATEVATCNGGYNVPRIMIKDEDGIYYYYTHLKPGSLTVKDGSSVVAGTVLGKIGPTECAQYTPTHLHFQMSSVPITNTESASEKTKYINPQPNLVSSFANLPKNVGDVGVAAAGSIDPEALKPSPCAPGTKDAGQAEGWYSGQRYSITLCSIPNLPSVGDEDRPAGGLARVNAAFSGDVLKLVTAAKAAGKTAIAESSFRTMAFQTRQYDGCTGSCVKGTTVKKPGYSIHQIGGAIDFDVHCGIDSNISGRSNPKCPLSNSRSVSPDDSMWEWLEAHAGGYGFKPYSAEAWHWSKTGE